MVVLCAIPACTSEHSRGVTLRRVHMDADICTPSLDLLQLANYIVFKDIGRMSVLYIEKWSCLHVLISAAGVQRKFCLFISFAIYIAIM